MQKMVSPSSRRRAAKYLVEEGLANAAQAYRALGLARSSYYLVGQKRPSSQKLERKIITLSEQHPRYGYRRITALMRRKGKPINAKRVQRVRRQAGLEVKERQKRTRRLGNIEAGAMECWITAPWASFTPSVAGWRFLEATAQKIAPYESPRRTKLYGSLYLNSKEIDERLQK